ncbi:MAG: S1 RNA-binding domain-containing protein [Myxococcota bacterium]
MTLPLAQTLELEIMRKVPMGLILGSEQGEVLLPKSVAPRNAEIGETLSVFVYTDSEDRPVATTKEPLARAGDFASLRVVEVGSKGAFLDWGLPKDLFLPFRSQIGPVAAEANVIVFVEVDRISQRPIATMKVEGHLSPPPEGLREGLGVDLLIFDETELGCKAVVDGEYGGLLYFDERGALPPEVGSRCRGYIARVRPDGKIDLTLSASGREGADHAQETLAEALRAAGGSLPLTDKSPPDEIRAQLGLSKKAFKRAVGGLYKARRIQLLDDSIKLTEPSEPEQTETSET